MSVSEVCHAVMCCQRGDPASISAADLAHPRLAASVIAAAS